MRCSSFGLKISAIAKANLSDRAAQSSSSRDVVSVSASSDDFSKVPVTLPLLLELGEVANRSRQPTTSPKASQDTVSRTSPTAVRWLCRPERHDGKREGGCVV